MSIEYNENNKDGSKLDEQHSDWALQIKPCRATSSFEQSILQQYGLSYKKCQTEVRQRLMCMDCLVEPMFL